MSKTVTYNCNVCTEIKTPTELKCVYFNSAQKNDKGTFGKYTLRDSVKDSDNHICTDCIKMITEYKPTT